MFIGGLTPPPNTCNTMLQVVVARDQRIARKPAAPPTGPCAGSFITSQHATAIRINTGNYCEKIGKLADVRALSRRGA